MEHSFLTPWQQFGLLGLIVGAVLFLLIKIIMWVMAFVKDMKAQMDLERNGWLKYMQSLKESLDVHTANAREFHNQQIEANRYARSEHERMISNLNEQAIVLGRINGYRKDC